MWIGGSEPFFIYLYILKIIFFAKSYSEKKKILNTSEIRDFYLVNFLKDPIRLELGVSSEIIIWMKSWREKISSRAHSWE